MEREDEKMFNTFIRPFFEKRGLPSSDSFLSELNDVYIEASKKIVHYRKSEALKKAKKSKYEVKQNTDVNTHQNDRPNQRSTR